MSIYSYLLIFIFYVFVKKGNFVFFLFFNVILFIERISSLYPGYQGEKLHKLKERLVSLYDLKKQ